LPASHDHNSGRLVFGPDSTLYYSIGDQGNNQNRNYCAAILSQVLPFQDEIDQKNWKNYPGKILRLNLDGSIPGDNPMLQGVKSHIFSYGHRNAQGLVFGSNGQLYSDEHGPNTDDEINAIIAGRNYGWPVVVGFRDNQAYDFCNWSSLSNCSSVSYSNGSCPEGAELLEETSLQAENYTEPLYSMFAVTDDYNYNDPACENSWICRPNVAPSSIEIYESESIPNWSNSLLVTSLKRGRIYRLKLNEEGTSVVGDTIEHFYTQNRYRDIAIAPDGKSIYILTDEDGRVSGSTGLTIADGLANPGNILKFTLQESVSTENYLDEIGFSVFPNPAKDIIFIQPKDNSNPIVSVQMYQVNGKLLINHYSLNSATVKISVSKLVPGLYFLRIITKNEQLTRRVIID
jgi:PQQ-dependent dehydrogenase (s-GDH family)